MLRIIVLFLGLVIPVQISGTAFAEQKSWSGIAEPRNRKEWVRAVQVRVRANLENIFRTSRVAGTGKISGKGLLTMRIDSDGRITGVAIRQGSGSEKLDESMVRGMAGLPQMPRFTPDMPDDAILVNLPINVE